jgi:dihydrofolate reductase
MRKLIYGGAVSLDGFLAGPSGALDWLHWSKDAEEIMGESMRGVDAYLMGRKTYEAALAMQPEDAPVDEKGSKSYVFSRSWTQLPRSGAELVREDAPGFVRRLKDQPGGKIVLMGGGELAQCLLGAGLVDEVGLNVHPVVLGRGVPVFRDPGSRLRLELLECRAIDGGCVFVNYHFKGTFD